jgi:hypothetical protein
MIKAGGPVLKALVGRSLIKARDKLRNTQCAALLNRVGVEGKKLRDVMHERKYDDPSSRVAADSRLPHERADQSGGDHGMRKKLTFALALLVSIAVHAQTRDVMDYGTNVTDASGRVVRLEGTDGIVVEYFYAPGTTEQIGWRVHVNDKLAFTMNETSESESIAIDGLPKIQWDSGFEGRTTSVFADGKLIAQLEYTPKGYFAAITLPGHFRWKTSEPSASRRVRQTVEDASGRVVANIAVTAHMSIDTVRRSKVYDVVADELGLNPHELKFDDSPTNYLTTVRDARGRVAFYVVGGINGDVGYSPDGAPLFYDIALQVEGGSIAPDSDLMMSAAWEGQRGTLPNHLVLTARGAMGVYAEESANDALSSVFIDTKGRVNSSTFSVHK